MATGVSGVAVRGPASSELSSSGSSDLCAEILTEEALSFLAGLVRELRPRLDAALAARTQAQADRDAGVLPDFDPATARIRSGDWTCAPMPAELADRRVEITGPVDRKMIINALNSGARVFMADFEDSNSPTWENVIGGQVHLRDAVRRSIAFDDSTRGKRYRLRPESELAVLMVRPRGWHLEEAHITVDGRPAPAGLVDFGLYMFHNARELVERGTAPYFYLPKLEHRQEARLWDDAFRMAQGVLGLPVGTIKATVLIETLPAVFQMNEILYALREHSAGLNCGRWDYIFSFIKSLSRHARFVLPERGQVGMDRRFLRSYAELLIATCHRRGVHAMGGMAAQIPIKRDPEANARALARVRADKDREVAAGHDGTWVAHPGLVSLAMEVFDAAMPQANQIDLHQNNPARSQVTITADDLLAVPEGTITEAGLRQNTLVGLLYVEAWLNGRGCVPLFDLMEDAATAEISRSQLWQWVHHGAALDDGRAITGALVLDTLDEQIAALPAAAHPRLDEARALLADAICAERPPLFLTLPAYERLLTPRLS